MQPTTHRPRFKICCISSLDEARLAIGAGTSALGLISRMPSGPGVIPDDLISEIAARVPPGIDTFLLTSLTDPDAIIEQHQSARTSTLQLVDKLEEGAHARLRSALPGIRIVQVIHVTDEKAIAEAEEVADLVDAVLLDSGNPDLEVKELGGTGRRHDWAISRRIRESLFIPVFLAGGLNPDNVAGAVEAVGPFGVDVCSGVRDEKFALDPDKLERFAAAVYRTTAVALDLESR